MRRNQRSKNRGVDQDDVEALGTKTNMSTDQPFDTDQPLFPGKDGRVDDLIKQVNIMEGYDGDLRAPVHQAVTPKKDDSLRRKSNFRGANG